jgi:hypothetical protein
MAEDGFRVCIYKEELWNDKEAMQALMRVDNDDADVQMREDELQFQGRVNSTVKSLTDAGMKTGKLPDAEAVLKAVTAGGLKTFTVEEAKKFIDFRLALTESVGDFVLL